MFGIGVSPSTGNEGRFILRVTERVSIPGRRHSGLIMMESRPCCVYMCIHFTLSRAIRLLGHHASGCVIDGTRIEDYTPYSLCNDRESGWAHICRNYFAFSLFCLCCRKCRNQEKKLVGRPGFLAGRSPFLVFTTKGGR